jgi:two-component system CheB/CheR fusion protein
MRMRPYRTVKNVITGVVITFINITERRKHADHLKVLLKELQHRTNNLFAPDAGNDPSKRQIQCEHFRF